MTINSNTVSMKTICLYFQIHQPFRLKRYRFFDIGNDHYYYDDYLNESVVRRVADKCYIPANKIILDLIKKHKGRFRVAYSLSGMSIDQMDLYAPEVLTSFQELSATGAVEFLAETNAHSLASLKDKDEFIRQVNIHREKIKTLFGQIPRVFRNTELVYSDTIGSMVAEMDFMAILTEGAKHILGWRSPNYLYYNVMNPKLKVLLRNFKLSDDIAFRFSNRSWSEWPLTAEKFAGWLKAIPAGEQIINIFIDYETFGEHHWADTGIFDFLKALPTAVLRAKMKFGTPSEIAGEHQPVAGIHVPHPVSWADEERDLTAWLGNDLQVEAFNNLYRHAAIIRQCDNSDLKKDWDILQNSDHFYYMCTKFFSDGAVHSYFNPYNSPYDAFINYMNVLNDFSRRLSHTMPENEAEIERMQFNRMLEEKDRQIMKYRDECEKLSRFLNEKKITTSRKRSTGTAVKKSAGEQPFSATLSEIMKKAPVTRQASGKKSDRKSTVKNRSKSKGRQQRGK